MTTVRVCHHVATLIACLCIPVTPLNAATVITGDVTPLPWGSTTIARIGDTADGSLAVDAGSLLESQRAYLGYFMGATGTATVTGPDSKWSNGGLLAVGYAGNGSLSIEAGGKVADLVGHLGVVSESTGVAVITGPGSQWTNSEDLYVGGEGFGTLTVLDAGQVTSGTLYASLDDLQGDGIIVANGAVLDADLLFDASHGTQNTIPFGSGGTLTVTAAGGRLGAGYKGEGSLTVSDGIVVSSPSGRLGQYLGAKGIATITGPGTQWNNSQTLSIGSSGNGTLRVQDGGFVSNSDGYLGTYPEGIGVATITGSGSRWFNHGSLVIGLEGSGTLRVENGGQVTSPKGYLGNLPTGKGETTIVGFGSRWASGSLYFGNLGSSGTLRVEDGGVVSSSNVFLGLNSPGKGTATITGPGSKWMLSSYLDVGTYGSGTLRVEDGGQVRNTHSVLGTYEGGAGIVTVTGPGSTWTNSEYVLVGRRGSGTLSIANGGLVSIADALTIDFDVDDDSFINMSTGGMLALKGVADDSLFQFFGLISGSDAIRYWDTSLSDWAPLTDATFGVDYTLQYLTEGELAGYTLLTVGVIPEQSTLALAICLCVSMTWRRR